MRVTALAALPIIRLGCNSACRMPSARTSMLILQVYKALRGGVQEVAVKVLLCTDEDQLNAFQKVSAPSRKDRPLMLL